MTMEMTTGFVAQVNAQSAFRLALLTRLVQKGLFDSNDAFTVLSTAGTSIAVAGDTIGDAGNEDIMALSSYLAEDFQRQAALFRGTQS